MAECARITQHITLSCDKPLQAGTKDIMKLINYDDWVNGTFTRNTSNEQIYEAIALPTSATAVRVEGQNNSNQPKVAFVRGRFSSKFDHEVKFLGFKIDPTTKSEFEKLCKGKVVAIVENNHKGDAGETAYEIYGADSGLIVPDGGLTRDPLSADTDGAYDITLKSSELVKEAHLPASLYITDYTASKAVFDGL